MTGRLWSWLLGLFTHRPAAELPPLTIPPDEEKGWPYG